MDGFLLARLQQTATTVYHIFFEPLTPGLSVLTAIFQTLWLTSDKEVNKKMAKFWEKWLLIKFAMGVVTEIVQEFQSSSVIFIISGIFLAIHFIDQHIQQRFSYSS